MSMTAGNPYGSRAARSERQKFFGTVGASDRGRLRTAGEISQTGLRRKGVTEPNMTSEVFLLFGDVDLNYLCCFGRIGLADFSQKFRLK